LIVSAPAGAFEAVQDALPAVRGAVHNAVAPVVKETVPDGEPVVDATLAEYLTDWPCFVVVGVTLMVVVVDAPAWTWLRTTWPTPDAPATR
jgi:hypothetical protein